MVVATSTLAGRPLQTEDAGVLDKGNCEVERAAMRSTAAGASQREWGLSLGCGLSWRSQIGLGLGAAREAGQTTRLAQLGGKTGLWRAQCNGGAELTLAWALGGSRDPRRDWSHTSNMLQLVASLPAGPAVMHLNLGHEHDRSVRQNTTTWNLALEAPPHRLGGLGLAPMAELFGDDRGSAWWNLALRATMLPERLFLDLSYGRKTSGGHDKLLTAGFKFAF